MIGFVQQNIGTIICSLILLAVVILIVRGLIKDHRKGKSSCGCNCAHCAMAGSCHAKKHN